MKFPRAAGTLLHPTSLPGPYGIGDMGRAAYNFVDFLAETRQKLWQVLPLSPPGPDNCPYSSLSVFAGNPLLIDLEQVADDGFLTSEELAAARFPATQQVDFPGVISRKLPLLKKSFGNFTANAGDALRAEYDKFSRDNAGWLDDYALFRAVRDAHGEASWNTWEEGIRRREPAALERWSTELQDGCRYYRYEQFQFFRQWEKLRRYCHGNGISLIGDMSLYVANESDDVWAHQSNFCLDGSGKPLWLAGVPPDYFSLTGQLWDNPIYCWDRLAASGYTWWLKRFRQLLTLVDIIRVDHFRGFAKYWAVPAGSLTAAAGDWMTGPGLGFFNTLIKEIGNVPVIAEDLGYITPDVIELRERTGFPGMKVLQFAFNPESVEADKPHNYPSNCAVYTGTHDNDTTLGWYASLDTTAGITLTLAEANLVKKATLEYTGTDGREINWDFVRLALECPANTAVIPLQDVLGLGSEARMNTPGTNSGNWKWRFTENLLTAAVGERLKRLTLLAGR